MTRPEIRPFADEHLDGAAALLAERHARHREVEPLLPAEVDFRARDREGARRAPRRGRPRAAARSSATCSASAARTRSGRTSGATSPAMPCAIPSSCATSMPRPRRAGSTPALTRHFVYVPAMPELVDPWFRLSFGASAALAARETAPEPPVDAGVAVRESTPDDVRAAAQLDRLMAESMLPSPSFSQARAGRRGAPSSTSGRTPGSSRRPSATSSPSATGRSSATSCSTAGRTTSACRSTRSTSPQASTRPSRAGHRRRRRAHPPRARLGVRAGLPDDDHGLAYDQHVRVPLLAEARVPAVVPPGLPLDPVVPRGPAPLRVAHGRRLRSGGRGRPCSALAAGPADRGRRGGRPRRAALPARGAAARVARPARGAGHAPRRVAGAPDPGAREGPAAGRASSPPPRSSSGSASRPSGRRSSSPPDSAAGRAAGPWKAWSRRGSRCASTARSPSTTPRTPTSSRSARTRAGRSACIPRSSRRTRSSR